MISGSFSLKGVANFSADRFTGIGKEDIRCCSVSVGGFAGRYCLNSRLPYCSDDRYFYDSDSDIAVLLQGNIYNRGALALLTGHEGELRDPRLIAALFMKEGPSFVKDLNGDFFFIIARPERREAFLYRDHIGIPPAAWIVDDETLSFSSDVTGLCRFFSGNAISDPEYLLGYFKYIDYRRTPETRVRKLLPGHFLHFSEGGVRIHNYWFPEKIKINRRLTYERMLSDLKEILADAVMIRCDDRFSAGAHVSSGLDSGIISALVRRESCHQETFYGFSWSPEDFSAEGLKYDERIIVRESCNKTGLTPVFSAISPAEFDRIISQFYHNQGFFSEDHTTDQALSKGVNLLFSGWGGDEFISTGDRGIETDLLRGFHWWTFMRRSRFRRPGLFVKDLLYYVIWPVLGILDSATVRSFRDDARYIRKKDSKSDRKAISNFYFHTSRHQLHLKMLRFYHLQARCESWALMGFSKGIEYRYPLLDRRIIEYMLTVPSLLLCRTAHFRPLLRELGEGIIPDEVRWQWEKRDPVYRRWMDDHFRMAAERYMNEVDYWRSDGDLSFADLDLLTADIQKFRLNAESVNGKTLFRAIIYFKAIHGFTKVYHER